MTRGLIYLYNGIRLSHKNEWNNVIWSNIDGPGHNYIKWSKPERERQILLICGILKKKITNELIYKTEVDSQTQKTDVWLPN